MAWQRFPGAAVDIAAGADGSVWVLGTDNTPGGHPIFRWDGQNWQRVDGGATAIAVGPDGQPWVANAAGEIFRRQGNTWQPLPGREEQLL